MARSTTNSAVARVIDAQSWPALFQAFGSHQQPSAYLIKRIRQHFFLWMFLDMCDVWRLWEGCGSSLDNWGHFSKHPKLLLVK